MPCGSICGHSKSGSEKCQHNNVSYDCNILPPLTGNGKLFGIFSMLFNVSKKNDSKKNDYIYTSMYRSEMLDITCSHFYFTLPLLSVPSWTSLVIFPHCTCCCCQENHLEFQKKNKFTGSHHQPPQTIPVGSRDRWWVGGWALILAMLISKSTLYTEQGQT